MISRTSTSRATAATAGPPPADRQGPAASVPGWQRSLAGAVKTVGELFALLDLDPRQLTGAQHAQRDFPLRVPRGFVDRMRRGDPNDPLLLQVLPVARELRPAAGYSRDPLAEGRAAPTPGLLHKYHGRALLVVSGACAVHCRYCFRRHFPYGDHQQPGDGWQGALRHIAADPTLREIILSGGDPLSAGDEKLAALASALAEIPHLRRLRVHTRMPIVLPERVDDRLLGWLSTSRLRPVVVVHANHRNEIDEEVRRAVARLRSTDITVLNQTVLLAGVNDRTDALVALSEALFEAGILPYYLHLMDRVAGAAHFEVDENRARQLIWELMRKLPGYLVPRLVREESGAPAKLPLSPFLARG